MVALTLIRHASIPSIEGASTRDILLGGSAIIGLSPSSDRPFGLDPGAPPDGLVIIDATGLSALPGLVDAHVHLTGGGGESGFKTRVPRRMLSDLVTAGVTTTVGVLGTDGMTRTMRDLVATALGLREEGLSAYCYTGNYAIPAITLTGSVRDDIVFCDPIIGVGELAISDHRSSQPTLDELLRIASDAYVAGLAAKKSGILHLHLGDGARGLDLVRRALEVSEIPARVFQPTHLNRNRRLWAEAKALAAERVAAGLPLPFFDVTAFPAEDVTGDTMAASEAILDWWRTGLPMDCLTVSSDGGGCLPVFDACGHMTHMGVGRSHTLLETLRAIVADGMPLALAAATCTSTPARALGLTAKGLLAEGKDADLVLLDETLGLQIVIARGRVLLHHGALLPAGRGTFEAEIP